VLVETLSVITFTSLCSAFYTEKVCNRRKLGHIH